jgi:hypothetical protein
MRCSVMPNTSVLYSKLSDNSEMRRRGCQLGLAGPAVAGKRSDGSNGRILPVGLAQFARIWRTGQRKLRRCGYQRRAENVSDRHHPVGEAKGHGGCAVAVLALQTRDRLAQRFVWTGQMIIESKPLRMMEQLLFGEQRPGLPGEGSNALSEGQIQPLNVHRINELRLIRRTQSLRKRQ